MTDKTDIETKREISHEEANEIATRFIDGHFRNAGKDHPRITIPADTERDDDILLLSYIAQQSRRSPLPGGLGLGVPSGRDERSDEHSDIPFVVETTPPNLTEWKRVVNDAYLLLADPRHDGVWQSGVNDWLRHAISLAQRATAPADEVEERDVLSGRSIDI